MYLKHTNLSLFRRAVLQTLDAVMYTGCVYIGAARLEGLFNSFGRKNCAL